MKGVSNTIKEFSDTYEDLYNSWKYVVEKNEIGILIKFVEYDSQNNNWNMESSITIPFSCAERLFSEVLKTLESNEFSDETEEETYWIN